MFVNPVINQDFPDPAVMRVGDVYYAYATNSGSINVQMARSKDLVHWDLLKDALPVLPSWSQPGHTWAPEVSPTGGGRYVMYFTARDTASGKQCIGVANGTSPEGPFTPANDKPLLCQVDEGGDIDPGSFVDEDGTRYVLWKNDGNCCGLETWISIQKASSDGLTLEGAPSRLIHADKGWEGPLVEAPTLWKHAGKYYLFYSANRYSGIEYAVGYAVADSPLGPYRKPAGPLLATSKKNGPVLGPGGEAIAVAHDGKTWMLYHSWDATVSYRTMSIDELVWEGDTPVVKGPNKVPEAAPG